MIRFTCGSCGKKLKAPENLAGGAFVCPSCHFRQTVPSVSSRPPSVQPPPPAHTTLAPVAVAMVSGGNCPQCGTGVSVASENLGALVVCPQCGTEFVAATPDSDIPLTPDPIPTTTEPASYSTPTTRRQPPGTIFAAGLIGLIFAVCVLVGIYELAQLSARVPRARPDDIPPVFDTALTTAQLMLGMACVLAIAYIVGVVLILSWVVKDARCRGADSGPIWVIVILFTNLIGLMVYLASRPTGVLVPCTNCGNKRLSYAKTCPHCHQAQ